MEDDLELEPEETEEGPDPLAELDDATQALIQARIEAQVTERAATEKAKLQEEFKQHQAGYTKRLSTGLRQMDEKAGLSLDAEGNLVYKDPAKFGQAALGMVGQAPAKTAALDKADEPIDYTEDADLLQAKIQRLVDRQAEEKFDARMKPVMERLDAMTAMLGVASQPALNGIPETARELLDELGVGSLADHQDFEAAVREAVKTNLKPAQWNDPGSVRAIALMVGGQLASDAPDRKTKRTEQTEAARNAALYRGSMAATGASRGGGRGGSGEAASRAEYDAFRQEFPDLADVSYERFKLTENDDANYGQYVAAGKKKGR